MKKSYWKDGHHSIIKLVLNGKRTVQQAKVYLEENFVGDSRKAFKHAAFEATSGDITNELKVYALLKDAINLGFGRDLNLEGAFR